MKAQVLTIVGALLLSVYAEELQYVFLYGTISLLEIQAYYGVPLED